MPIKEDKFNSLEDLGRHFGIEPEAKGIEHDYSAKTPFLGRAEELLCLHGFIENSKKNIFGLYGVPMIGKSFLVKQFIKKDNIVRPFSKLITKFQNPENPEITLKKHILGEKNILDISFDRPTLIVIENFEECLEWKGNLQQLHSVRVKFPLIVQFLKRIATLQNVKLILESRFQINTPAINIQIDTLPEVELKGVDTTHFKSLYNKAGISDDEFNAICINFSQHTWLLSKAYHEMDWLFQNNLHRAATRPQTVTSFLWELLEKIISRLHKSDIMLLCALTLKSPIPYHDLETIFENQPAFKNFEVFESLNSLERKFLIQENHDNYEINPYLREICFSFIKRKRSREIKLLKSLDYFAAIPEPEYNIARQSLESGRYGDFYKQIHRLQRERKFEEAHEVLNYALETDPIIKEGAVLNEIAITYKKQRKFQEAIQLLKKAIEVGNIQSYNELAIIYREQGKHNDAINLLEKAIELDNIQSYNELAIIYKQKKQYDKAIGILESGLEKEPNNIKLLNELAIIYKQQKEYGKALNILNRISNSYPLDLKSLMVQADIYEEQGKYVQASAILEKALSKDINNEVLLTKLATVCMLQNNDEKAVQLLEKVAKSGFLTAYDILAKFYLEQKQFDLALSTINKGLSVDPKDNYLSNTKRKILRKKNTVGNPVRKTASISPKKKLQRLLMDDKLNKFIKEYLTIAEDADDDDLQEKLMLESGRLAGIENDRHNGNITLDEYMKTITNIRVVLRNLWKQMS